MNTTRPPGPVRESNRQRRLRDLKSVPVLPSLITLANVFLGFLAIAKVTDAVQVGGIADSLVMDAFEVAALCLFGAMVFDALDGRVARMTGQTSAFGAQLDSLADMVTFGVAPAFVAKLLINLHEATPNALLPTHPRIYYFCAAVFVLCAAMRLARFNVETGATAEEHQEFRGLPSPGAAAVIAAMIVFYASRDDEANMARQLLPLAVYDWVIVALPGTLVLLGLLMVSRVPFPHFAELLLSRRHSFPFLATLVVLIGLAALEWQLAMLLLAVSYLVIGVGLGCLRMFTRRDRPGVVESDPSGDGPPGRSPPGPNLN